MAVEARGLAVGQHLWVTFRARIRADDPRSAFADAWQLVDRLAAERPADGEHALAAIVAEGRTERLKALYLVLVERTGGPDGTGPAPNPPLDVLVKARRELSSLLAETAVADDQLTVDDLAAAEVYGPIDVRLHAVVTLVAAGQSSDRVVDDLRLAVDDYRSVIRSVKASASGARLLQQKLATALYWTGVALTLRRDDAEAVHQFAQARDAYEAAGDPQGAEVCRKKITLLDQRQSPDTDLAMKSLLGQLESVRSGTLEHADVQVGLARLTAAQGDLFGARAWVDKATAELEGLRYPSPPQADAVDETVAGWIDAIPEGEPGANRFFAAFAALMQVHSSLAAVQQVTFASEAPRYEAVIDHLAEVVAAMPGQLATVDAELQAQLHGFAVPGWDPGTAEGVAAQALAAANMATFMQVMRAIGRIEDALSVVTTEDGEADALVALAAGVVTRARTLHHPVTTAQALQAHAQTLQVAGRPADAVGPLQEALQLVSVLGGATERDVAIEALSCLIQLYFEMGDVRRASDTAGEAIARIERDRYRVNAPYLQSTYLGNYQNVVVGGIFSAFKLGDNETMLARMELAKARASVRSLARRQGVDDVRLHDLDQELRAVTAEIHKARTEAPDALAGLQEKRQRLWDLRAIQESGEMGEAPAFSLAAIQAALGPDEATISYFWLSPTVLMVSTVTSDAIEVERNILTPAHRQLLERFILELSTLAGSNLALDAAFIEPLAESLLPEKGLALLEGKHRLAVSPHRLLHWFPFHALPWGDQRLAQRLAVRYIPNLTSLLVKRSSSPEALMVGVGVSHFPAGQGLSDLAGVEEEIDAIASTYREQGFATQTVVEVTTQQWNALGDDGTLARAACLHFSTHGAHVLADAPMESAIFVADGQLDGLEIAGLHLNCEVVALGSCDSGQRAITGRGWAELPGDELFGLPAAFLAAGARSVLAAAWPADNTTAAILMAYWHRHLAAGEPADVALQHAQCDFLAQADFRTKRAYFWAPFFLVSVGAPAPIPSPVREPSPTEGADG